jgi:NADPH:quinone reductase-like Zn-dependent oxidoreductase
LQGNALIDVIQMEGVEVHCALVYTPDPQFDRLAPENRSNVLIKVRAFSCNYRDKGQILKMATRGPNNTFYVVGSEFVGEVLAVGSEVTGLRIGDRVIGNNSYPKADVEGVPGGIPTNHASKEYQVLHSAKLIKIPPTMSDEVAAGFSIGAQTNYSMIRKLNLQPGENVLVTAATSNTSLFAINALRQYPVQVYATSTSGRCEAELKAMGVKQLFQIDLKQAAFFEDETMREVAVKLGGFNAVIDPFYDLYLGKVVSVMAPGGRYVTCGYYEQYQSYIDKESPVQKQNGGVIMSTAMMGNMQIIGNCIGVTEDLRQAIADYAADAYPVVIDSVWSGQQVGAFFERTYNAPNRFGKIIYKYD